MTDLHTRLMAEIDAQIAKCDAAIDGPWEVVADPVEDFIQTGYDHPVMGEPIGVAEAFQTTADAAFIVAARTGYPALLHAARETVGRHHPRPWELGKDAQRFGQHEFPDQCDFCRVPYPCDHPDILAIATALGVDVNE